MTHTRPSEETQRAMQETEMLLRAVLHEHAQQTVDLEQSWSAISNQLAPLDSKLQPGTGLQPVSGSLQTFQRKKRWPLALVAALVLALLWSGFAASSHWFSSRTGRQPVYPAVNQSMTADNGVTLTAGKGYTDPERLILYYDVQSSSDLRTKYNNVAFVNTSTIQGKPASGLSVCEFRDKDDNPVTHCVFIVMRKNERTQGTLQVTWQVSEVLLGSPGPKGPSTRIQGNWKLQFTIPISHQVPQPIQIFPTGTAVPASLPPGVTFR